MAETPAQRITQLESIVNELTARVAADPENMDLPPLLADAKAELADLESEGAAADRAAADRAAADRAAADRAAADRAAADKAAADAKAVADAKAAAAAAAASAPASAPAKPTSFRKEAIDIKSMPPTVPASMRAGGRPNPAAPRPAPVSGTSRSGH
jgi:peptidoglycan hydrolase CwlO-like protein